MLVLTFCLILYIQGPQLHWMVAEDENEDDSEPAESMESSSLLSLET